MNQERFDEITQTLEEVEWHGYVGGQEYHEDISFLLDKVKRLKEELAAEKIRADELQTRSAEWICRYNNDKTTYHKSNEMAKALRQIRQIANDADLEDFAIIVDQVLGRE
ncbi:hypothetical protein BVG16_16430 [Paenibacillus selenitireducens]|uniref:Uncharacterized protein n=1 Tax=Paenibacillus selenitireducens TaxID=1324314 RepID=A0A1T2XAM8_9BACL|nr:hypothetical protein [Paenibacillus selenitireducens]OPA76756.1 hypothetical protein BVG16_16430 [Paenibacillus selenitireducens]